MWYEHCHATQMDVRELEKALSCGAVLPPALGASPVRETPPLAAPSQAGMPLSADMGRSTLT